MDLPLILEDFWYSENRNTIFLGIIVLIAVIIGLFFILQPQGTGELTILVTNPENQGLWKATVKITNFDETFIEKTDRTGNALFTIPIGKEIDIEISGTQFKTNSQKFVLTKEKDSLTMILEPEIENIVQTKTITFVGPNGVRVDGKLITIELSCSTGILIDSPIQQISGGLLEVTSPSGCGSLLIKASASGFETASFNADETSIMKFSSIESTKGKLKVIVKDSKGLLLEGISIKIEDLQGVPFGTEYTSFGESVFELESGIYKAIIEDNSAEFSSSEKEVVVNTNEETIVNVVLTEEPLGIITARVVDYSTNEEIQNAIVVLEKHTGEKTSREFIEDKINFTILEHGTYKLSAIAKEYALGEAIEINSVDIEESVYVLKLKKCTPFTCGVLKVKVIDEDELIVSNARVGLINSDTGFFCEEYGLKYSNAKGEAKFSNLSTGNYRILVQKFPSETESDDFEFITGVENEKIVTLFIGEGTIEVEVLDKEGSIIPFGFAEFRTDFEVLGKVPLNAEGKGILTTKADKKIFVTIDAEDYTSFTSKAIQVLPNQKTTINAILEKEILGDEPTIEFIGLFDEIGKEISGLSSGKTVKARFNVKVPVENEYEQLSVFVRVGEEDLVEKDEVYISSINAPETSVVKGKTYTPPKGDDETNLTNGDGKWIIFTWEKEKIKQGIYEVEVELSVKDSVVPGKFLPLYYRIFATEENARVIRNPFDEELGYSSESPSKQGLYAEAYEKGFYEGNIESCEGDFCYSETMLDLKDDILISAPYDVRVFSEYDLEFWITNNSPVIHDNAELRIKTSSNGVFTEENIKINSYKIINADSQEFSSTTSGFEIAPILLGDLRQNKNINAKLSLRPEELGQSSIQVQVISDNQIVFEKFININVVKQKDIEVEVLPEIVPAFTDFDLNVNVKLFVEEDEFLEVEGALVRVERTTPDRQKITIFSTTNGAGEALINIPASPPNTRIKIRVEKEGYSAKTIKLKTTSEILLFDPKELSSELDLTNNEEEKLFLSITNLVPINLHLTKLNFSGSFLGLLDESKMNNWLNQYLNKVNLNYEEPIQLSLISAISEDARLINEIKKIKGNLLLEVANYEESIFWPIEMPFTSTISLAEMPQEEGCISVSLKDWKDSTIGGKAEVEFSIRNNCLSKKGLALNLRNLKAKIKWNSNKFGNVEINVQDPESGQEANDVLTEGFYSELFSTISGEQEFLALLTFTPKGGTVGKTAEFEVMIDAAQLTTTGEQLVGSSNSIDSEISIINLAECMQYTPDPEVGVILEPTANEGTIEIDSSNCGNTEISVWLCKDDDGCTGGTEGGIIVKPEQFKLTPNSSTQTISVSREEIPGLYGVTVFVKTLGSNYREIGLIDVLAKPTPDDAFDLTKYEFAIKEVDAKDSAELTNKFFTEQIMVDASICDWGTATENEDEWFDWQRAGIGGLAGALQNLKPLLSASKTAATQEATNASEALDSAKEASKKSNKADKLAKGDIETLCTKISQSANTSAIASSACAGTGGSAGTTAARTSLTKAKTKCEEIRTEIGANFDLGGEIETVLAGGVSATGVNVDEPPLNTTEATESRTEKLDFANKELPELAAELATAATNYQSATASVAGSCTVNPAQCFTCTAKLETASADLQVSVAELEEYSSKQFTGALEDNTALNTSIENANQSIDESFDNMDSVLEKAKAVPKGGGNSALLPFLGNTAGGFLLGGLSGNLFGEEEDPCLQRHSQLLPDYIINMLTDAKGIDLDNEYIILEYDKDSAKIIGNYETQKIGVIATNLGIEEERPVYGVGEFKTTQHIHANPTEIERGNDNFGPFKVPDKEIQQLNQRIHLKFKTSEVKETIPELSFDTVSCISGNKIGRTGKGALPRIKLDWSFSEQGITKDSCLEGEEGIYCDATQFGIMLSKRMNNLMTFFEGNSVLNCPENPLTEEIDELNSDLNVNSEDYPPEECYITTSGGYLESRPAIMQFIEGNDFSSTSTISSSSDFEKTIGFNALLMKDSFSKEFFKDFAKHYSDERFFDTPDWFYGSGLDSEGNEYGLARLFETGRVSFTNRFFDSENLSSAGLYKVLISIVSDDDSFLFFKSNGEPNVFIEIQVELLSEPNPNSIFYSVPFDGLVGLKNGSFNRQRYGSTFENNNPEELITINNDSEPVKTYTDSGSNAVVKVDSSFGKSFFVLNSSPSSRGNLLAIEKNESNSANILFTPSKATPVMLKVTAEKTDNDLSVFYTVSSNDVPKDVGNTMTYWSGAGACLDPQGVLITEKFDQTPDRAANSKDSLYNWQQAYAIDFGEVSHSGNAFLRTIFYTDPLDNFSIRAENQNLMNFLTPNESGAIVSINGISGSQYNNTSGGGVTSIEDVFNLVEEELVCVVDSGRKASFFWNPKKIFETTGSERNISEETNSLIAGETCIG